MAVFDCEKEYLQMFESIEDCKSYFNDDFNPERSSDDSESWSEESIEEKTTSSSMTTTSMSKMATSTPTTVKTTPPNQIQHAAISAGNHLANEVEEAALEAFFILCFWLLLKLFKKVGKKVKTNSCTRRYNVRAERLNETLNMTSVTNINESRRSTPRHLSRIPKESTPIVVNQSREDYFTPTRLLPEPIPMIVDTEETVSLS